MHSYPLQIWSYCDYHNIDYCRYKKRSRLFFQLFQLTSIILKQNIMEKPSHAQIIENLKADPFLNHRYEILEIIGQGCFGKIIKVISKLTNKVMALKLQKLKKQKMKAVLKNQIDILAKLQDNYGIPIIYEYGEWVNGTYLQMELLQHDLNQNHKYTIPQIIDLTLELLRILCAIHGENVIHQDLKPHNIMKGLNNKLYIIDFGLAKRMKFRKNTYLMKGFIGTPRYASIRAHNMEQQSKKDDLQSLFYNIAYLYYQKLPWIKLKVNNSNKLDKIKALKLSHRQTLFNEMPLCFQKAFEYIINLETNEEPNYPLLKGYFRRNNSVKLDPIIQFVEERGKTKKVSLNMSNFLQVPVPQFKKKRQLSKQNKRQNRCSINSDNSYTSGASLELFSDRILKTLLQISDQNGNFGEQQNIEPILPVSAKISRTLILKNPFL